MAVCEKCKTFYLNDECPTCKRDRLAAEAAAASAPKPAPAPAAEQYPKPGAKKKAPREVLSMSGWAGFSTFLGSLAVIAAVLSFALNPIYAIAVLIGSMSFFCAGKLFKCVTQILKNQDEILTALDKLTPDDSDK